MLRVIKMLPKGKFPGPDEFSNEYYQIFGECLGTHLPALFSTVSKKPPPPGDAKCTHRYSPLAWEGT